MSRIRNWGWFEIGLTALIFAALIPRLMSYSFSLPYVDHADEPNYYLAAQEVRGLFDNEGYYDHALPVYIYLATLVQAISEPLGAEGMAAQVRLLRLLSIAFNLLTLAFIAFTGRRAAGDLAGLMAGLFWAASSEILTNGVYALPDPLVYLLAALTLWFAGEALAVPARRHWTTWSAITGIIAVATKAYLPMLVPGILTSLTIAIRNWRDERWNALRDIAIQTVLVALLGLWLVLGVGFSPTTQDLATDNTGVDLLLLQMRERMSSQLFNPSIVANNIRYALVPLNSTAALSILGAGGLASVAAHRMRRKQAFMLSTASVIVVYMVVAGWIVAAYTIVTPNLIRYAIPATVGGCILLGFAVSQLGALIEGRWRLPSRIAVVLGVGILMIVPQVSQNAAVVADRSRGDLRADLRLWAEQTLEAGPVLVTNVNHKTFNHIWSGIPVAKWFSWLTVEAMNEEPATRWREERGMMYALLTHGEQEAMQQTTEGRAFLDHLLLLRSFPERSDRRGPAMSMYRLWQMEHQVNSLFGDSIRLAGYDTDLLSPPLSESLRLRLYWHADSLPPGDYSMFLHLVPLDSLTPFAQWDGPPAMQSRPTPSWNDSSETLVGDWITIEIPADIAPGEYRLLLGLYDYQTGIRLAITGDEGAQGVVDGNALHLLAITVE